VLKSPRACGSARGCLVDLVGMIDVIDVKTSRQTIFIFLKLKILIPIFLREKINGVNFFDVKTSMTSNYPYSPFL